MNIVGLRLKLQRFMKKNSRLILIIVFIWIVIFFVNMFLKSYEPPLERQTTYKPEQSVMDTTDVVPKTVNSPIEDLIDEYVGYCNDGNWQKAFDMLCTECQEYSFNNDIEDFMEYVYTKMPTPKKYVIQNYSNDGNTYIYQVKYLDDIMASGLTNTTYQFTEEKMIFKKQRDNTYKMAVGNFVDFGEIKNISENEYLKVDVKSVVKFYSMESYLVKLTNRTDNIIVIADNQESNEVVIKLDSANTRPRNSTQEIVLQPKESREVTLNFQKFYDNDDNTDSLIFNSIRVMEKYSGTENVAEEIIQSEIQNAIAKFSVNIPVTYDN